MTGKNRLDAAVVERGLVPSREKARAFIMAGEVRVDGQVVFKPDKRVSAQNRIEIKRKYPYVSRGAFKIEKAFNDFSLPIKGRTFLDIGISTGGFADYVLKHGAASVVGVDVNTDQVDYNLRKNPRLRLLKMNARNLKQGDIDFEPDVIIIDVSFISVTKILPALSIFKNAQVLILVKPQFEAERREVGRGGLVKARQKRVEILLRLKKKLEALDFSVIGCTPAGIKGRKGNQEYFFLVKYGKNSSINDKIVDDAVEV